MVAENWEIHKPSVHSADGLVAAQSTVAASIGADVLKRGGNAVDAAVSSAFALGCCEPWMSGIGGGGFLVVYIAEENSVSVIDFSMISPTHLKPDRYPLCGGFTPGLFTWPTVEEDRNLKGYESICIPGAVDGLGLALEKFGSISFAEALSPAVQLAESGLPIDWFASHIITTSSAELTEFSESKKIFLPKGHPPVSGAKPLELSKLAQTMRLLAVNGRRDFYEGEVAKTILADLQSGGSVMTAEDLRSYHAELVSPISFSYRNAELHVPQGLCAGPTFHESMEKLEKLKLARKSRPDAFAYLSYAQTMSDSYATRFSNLGHDGSGSTPNCTTHVCVADGMGNMVSLTNTLLAYFGSKVVLPESGILMNNGVMWFDPRPMGPNKIAPGVRPLTNMCPLIATRDDRGWIAAGASGGRHIMAAVAQLTSFLVDYGLDLETAIHLPRIDVTGPDEITYDKRMSEEVISMLASQFPVTGEVAGVYPVNFASPSAVVCDLQGGGYEGATYPYSPWSGVVGTEY